MNQKIQSAALVMEKVSQYSGIPYSVLRSKTRKREIVIYRHLAEYFLLVMVGLKTTQAANLLGRINHTSAIHGRDTIIDFLNIGYESITKPYDDIVLLLNQQNDEE